MNKLLIVLIILTSTIYTQAQDKYVFNIERVEFGVAFSDSIFMIQKSSKITMEKIENVYLFNVLTKLGAVPFFTSLVSVTDDYILFSDTSQGNGLMISIYHDKIILVKKDINNDYQYLKYFLADELPHKLKIKLQ